VNEYQSKVIDLFRTSDLSRAHPKPTKGLVHYKFRSDSTQDVIDWYAANKHLLTNLIVTTGFIGGHSGGEWLWTTELDCEFYSNESLSKLQRTMKEDDEDWHIMFETLNYADIYDGERADDYEEGHSER
jgi:hypothetical protein